MVICRALGLLQDATAVPALIELLDGWRTPAQSAAAQALGEIGDNGAVAALCRTLAEKRDPDLRATAGVALERLGDPAAVPALIAATRRSSGEGGEYYYYDHRPEGAVRVAAVHALGTLGSPDAVDPLVDAVHDPSDRVRLAAVRALAPLGTPRSVPHLLAARHDVSDQVVEAATEALIAQDPDLMETVLLELFDGGSPVDLSKAALGLERLGSEAARSRLIAALREPDRDVRMTAAQALGHAGDHAAVLEPLIQALDDPDLQVRREAMLALAETGDPRAEPHLRDRGGDPDWLILRATERWSRVRQERQSAKPSPPTN